MKILFLCTGNRCRSQMAEGFLKALDSSLTVCSAGTFPAKNVHPTAIEVMKERGVGISLNKPKMYRSTLIHRGTTLSPSATRRKKVVRFFWGVSRTEFILALMILTRSEGLKPKFCRNFVV